MSRKRIENIASDYFPHKLFRKVSYVGLQMKRNHHMR